MQAVAIWLIFMQAIASLKICNLIGFVLSNAYKVLDEKVQRGMSHDT